MNGSLFKAGVKSEILKNRECRISETITELYVKVNISRMKMS